MPNIQEIRQKFPHYSDLSDEQLADALHKKFYSDLDRADFNKRIGLQAQPQAEQPAPPETQDREGAFGAFTGAAQSGSMFGFDDEIMGAAMAPFEATKDFIQGEGFDLARGYRTARDNVRGLKEERRENHPVASTAGEIVGGLTTAGGAARKGATLLGRGLGTKAAVAEGAVYGGLSGAGNADENKLQGATSGALFGGISAGVLDKAGRSIVGRISQGERNKAIVESVETLENEATQLYTKARQANVTIKPEAMKRVGLKVIQKAGNINQNLRPKTAGIVQEFAETMNQPTSLEAFDELRQTIGQAMKRAEPQDMRTLSLMKNEMDRLVEKLSPKDVTGDIKGFSFIKEARDVYSRKSKAELIGEMFGDADVNTGQFTQSGLANTIGKEFRKLSRNRKQMARFSKEEQGAIRKIAKGETSGRAIRFLAKFAPRGVVSAILSTGGGAAVGGPALGVALPMAGHVAARSADKATVNAARNLQGTMALNQLPPLMTEIPGALRPLVPATASQTGGLSPTLLPEQPNPQLPMLRARTGR